MAALDFYSGSSLSNEYLAPNGRRWVWDGAAWVLGFGALNIGATGLSRSTDCTGVERENALLTSVVHINIFYYLFMGFSRDII